MFAETVQVGTRAGARDPATRLGVRWRHLGALLLLAALAVAGACPRGALATLRLVTLDLLPAASSPGPPQIAEPAPELSFAVVPAVVRRRLLAAAAPLPPDPDRDGAAPRAATATLVALLVAWVPVLPRSACLATARGPTVWGRAPPVGLTLA